MQREHERPRHPEAEPDEHTTSGGDESPSADRPPALPADDDAALGDADQHSEA